MLAIKLMNYEDAFYRRATAEFVVYTASVRFPCYSWANPVAFYRV